MKRIVRKATVDTAEIENTAVALAELSKKRLALVKQEEEAKASLQKLMESNNLGDYKFTKGKTAYDVKMVCREMTVVDTEKLAKKLTPEEFRACAKVSLTDARKICSQTLIDECSRTEKGAPYVQVKTNNA